MRVTLFALLATTLGLSACTPDDELASCVVGGVTHPHGSDFEAPDGCNTCHCENGQAACTLLGCVTTCTYDGTIHEAGTTFPSTDGCNTCSCGADGTVACTTRACVTSCTYDGKTYPIGGQFPAVDGCNTCTCTASGAAICTQTPCVTTCSYDGANYEPGDEFPAVDGCNTCTCAADGTVGCTKIGCPQTCTYDGHTRNVGDQFASLDGCNTCTCMAGGAIACTEMACACNPDTEWWRYYESKDAVACGTLTVTCPGDAVKFQNACGCGCEQSRECAKEIDCFGASCDFGAVQDACPYSLIDTVTDCSAEVPCTQFQCKTPGSSWGCGQCQDPPEGTTCETDAACLPGSICEPLRCACHGQSTCIPGCTSDGECGEGEMCGLDGRCAPMACTAGSCPANFGCETGHCQRRTCTASSTCDADGFCVNGACYAETGNCYPPVP